MLDTGRRATDEVPCGAPLSSTVHVVMDNTLVLGFDIYEKGPDCQETWVGFLPPDGEFAWDGLAGNVGVVRDEQDGLYQWFSLPADGSAFTRVTVP